MSNDELEEARSEARAILALRDSDVGDLFFQKAMKRNLTRTVRHLDLLVANGSSDRDLGTRALERLGFPPLS